MKAKKLIASVLVCLVAMMGMTTMAFAEGNVASVNGVGYATLAEAIENANGATVTLLADITLTEKVVIDEAVVIDGAGKTITTAQQKLFEVFADFEVANLNMVSTSAIGRCVDTRVEGIEVTIEGCTIEAMAGDSGVQAITIGGYDLGGLTVNVKDTTINAKYAAIIMYAPATVNVENSDLKGWTAIYAKGPVGSVTGETTGSVINVVNSELASVSNVSGGTDRFGVIAIEDNGVTVSVDAASKITVDAQGAALQTAVSFYDESVVADVTLNAAVELKGNAAAVVGGLGNNVEFVVTNADVIEAVKKEGYNVAADGKVTETLKVAEVGGVKYATLAEAIENANGATVTLLADITLTEKVVIDEAVVVDGAGKTITTAQKKLFEVFADFEVYDLNMVNTNKDGRCVDTRVDGINVVIDGCDLRSTGSVWAQTITVGGSSMNGLDITITDSKVTSNKYTAIIMFVPANIEITNSEISGYAAIYAKGEAFDGNTTGSEITVVNSDLVSKNTSIYPSDRFGTIVVEDDGVTITVDETSSIVAETTDGTYQSAILFKEVESSVTAACPITTIGNKSSVLADVDGATVVVTNPDVIEAVKKEGYDVADNGAVSVPEIRWITDTDAGFYMDAETKYGMMRFLFAVDLEGEIEATGIKYIKVDDKNAEGVTVGGGNAAAFYGDVYGIPETEAGNTYYAVAYVTTAAGTEWSDVVACKVDMTSQQFTEYAPGGAQ